MKVVVGSLSVESEVVVIGGGPGGYVAAIRAAMLGKDVMLVEKESKLGGVCLNWGCIPTKAMIKASDYYGVIKELEEMGILIDGYKLDFVKMRGWKQGIIDNLEKGIRSLLKKYGVEVIEGRAVFDGHNSIRIEGKSDVNKVVFDKCIISTGSHSIEVSNLPFSDPHIVCDKDILKLDEVPSDLVIVGGGYIGTEMATVFSKLGSKVHIVELGSRLIPLLDEEITSVIEKMLVRRKVNIHFNTKIESFSDGLVTLGNGDSFKASKILVVVGRRPNVDLGLDAAGVEVRDGFIFVDDFMRTSNPNIFAVGDVCGQPMLAHKASRQGKVAAEVICGLNSKYDNLFVPSVVFNDPELAQVGYTEKEALSNGYEVVVGKFPFKALGRAMIDRKTEGFVKLIGDKKTDRLLGMQAVGPGVSEFVGEVTLGIELGCTLEDIALTIHPHPTNSESLVEAAEAAKNASVHIFQK